MPLSTNITTREPRKDFHGHDLELVKAFASMIGKPGGNALLIDEHNRRGAWVPIDELRNGLTFAIEVANNLLAIDFDGPARRPHLDSLFEELRSDGLRPILVNSGRPGHVHLFCRIGDPSLWDRYRLQAKARGFETRKSIRPPLSPHRLGLPVSLLFPADPGEALAALAPIWILANRDRSLSPAMAKLLKYGDTNGRYKSRSEVIQALALGAVNAEWTQEEFLDALTDERNGGGEKFRTLQNGRRYVTRSWEAALRTGANSPAIRNRADALTHVAMIRAAVSACRWARHSDRLVMEAHLKIAETTGKLTHHADVRTLAMLAGYVISTVAKAHLRLRDAGWLHLVRGACPSRSEATVWAVRTPRMPCTAGNIQILSALSVVSSAGNMQTIPYGGRVETVRSTTLPLSTKAVPGHDLWRPKGLGKACFLVWRCLDEATPHSARELGRKLNRRIRTVQRCLARLKQHSLAVRDAGGWRRGDADLNEVATELHVAGTAMLQRSGYERQREAFRERGRLRPRGQVP
jgi:hypothetical protein